MLQVVIIESVTNTSGDKTAMGSSTTASARASTAVGMQTTASGIHSTAMGEFTRASGYFDQVTQQQLELFQRLCLKEQKQWELVNSPWKSF